MKKLCFIILATMLYIPLRAQICIRTEGYTPQEVNGVKMLEICPGETIEMKAEACANPAATITPTWTLPGDITLPAGYNEIIPTNPGLYSVKNNDGQEDKIEIVFKTVDKMTVQHPKLTGEFLTFCDNETVTITNSQLFTDFKWFFNVNEPLGNASSITIKRSDVPEGGGDFFVEANNNGCVARSTFLIALMPKPVVNLPSDTALCPGKSLIIGHSDSFYGNPNYPVGTFTATWTKPAPQPPQKSQYINVQYPGKYIVKVDSPFGCITNDTVEVLERPVPELEAIPDSYVCRDGEALLKVVVGNNDGGNYDYRWSVTGQGFITNNGAAEARHTPQAPVTDYRVVVYNQYFCEASTTARVLWYADEVKARVSFADTSACGLDPILLEAHGTNGNEPYSYQWFPEVNMTNSLTATPSVIPISQDTITYSVVVTDSKGCKDTSYVTVKTPDMRVDIQEGSALHICEQKSVQLNALITGGQPPYSYKWLNENQTLQSISGVQALTNVLTIPRPGDLSVPEVRLEVTDERGCPVFDKIDVNVFETPRVEYTEATRNYFVCTGNSIKFAAPDVSGGTGLYNYVWTGPSLSDHSRQPTYTPNPGEVGTKIFTVRIEDARVHCPGNTENILVTIVPTPSLAFATPDTGICEDAQAVLVPSVKTGDLTFEWQDNAGAVVSSQKDYTTSSPGKYTLTIREPQASCSTSAYKTVFIKTAPTYANISAESNALNNESFELIAETDDASPAFTWTTTGNGEFENAFVKDPVYYPTLADSGLVVFTATMDGTCTDNPLVATHEVLFSKYVKPLENIVFVPNVFAPFSSNEKNRTLMVFSETIAPEEFNFVVYNRWGQIVFETSSVQEASMQGWNGQLNNSGTILKADVYTYLVKGKFKDGNTFEQSGSATLLR